MTDKDELKAKAKDLPLLVIQTTLSAAGQALLLADRVKNSIKGLAGRDEEETTESKPSAAEQVAAAEPEEKPARREPVIFAPRPSTSDVESNGAAKTKPEPVIFAPKPAAAEPVTPEPVATKPVSDEPVASAEPVAAPEPVTAPEPVAAPEPVSVEAVGTVPDSAEPAAKPKPKAAPKPKPKAEAKPKAAPKPRATKAAKPVEVVEAGSNGLVEPLPGYSDLTVASLRARLRGKSADQINELLAYEQATQAREEVIRMYENRLAKLAAE
ncbi:hypothetical protein ACIBG8_47735 [Nonomuraea sp. NPDC050556]|uniref:hypothetical protein n=1 Tax=Nonomuraea sp. NPDC050556 TaxID=3364369 RepID=UPI0037ACE24C